MKLIILAAGGLGRTIADVIGRTADFETVGFCDDSTEIAGAVMGLPILADTDHLAQAAERTGATGAVVAVGNGAVRLSLAAKALAAGLRLPNIVDPTAVVSAGTILPEGVVIAANATIGPGVEIGRLTIIASGAVVEHDASLGEACYVGPGCLVDARATIAAGLFLTGGTVVGHDERVG